jgi:hypothetical protein
MFALGFPDSIKEVIMEMLHMIVKLSYTHASLITVCYKTLICLRFAGLFRRL